MRLRLRRLTLKDENKWEYTGTREELIAMGDQPCKTCKP